MCAAWTNPHVAFSFVLGNIVVWPMLAAMVLRHIRSCARFSLTPDSNSHIRSNASTHRSANADLFRTSTWS
ncbi:hypothetical protein V8C37DRAFT_397104 [Trichoderma ceciliae]